MLVRIQLNRFFNVPVFLVGLQSRSWNLPRSYGAISLRIVERV